MSLLCRAQGLAPSRTKRVCVVVECSGKANSSLAVGAKVKVNKAIKVYHVPKVADGLELEGMQGVVVKDESTFKGKVLSANCPYKVEFAHALPDGASVKFIAHLADDEVQVI